MKRCVFVAGPGIMLADKTKLLRKLLTYWSNFVRGLSALSTTWVDSNMTVQNIVNMMVKFHGVNFYIIILYSEMSVWNNALFAAQIQVCQFVFERHNLAGCFVIYVGHVSWRVFIIDIFNTAFVTKNYTCLLKIKIIHIWRQNMNPIWLAFNSWGPWEISKKF